MGGKNWKENLNRTPFPLRIAAVTIFLFFPAVTGLFSWTVFLIPLFVFFLLYNFEEERVYAHIIPALLAGGISSFFLSSLPSFFMAVSLLPVGHVLSYAAKRHYPVWRSGLAACLVLIVIWAFGGILISLVLDINIYQETITGLNSTLAATFKAYQDTGNFTPQMAMQFEEAMKQLRALIPKIFPAITINTVIITIWLNLLLGNRLVKKVGRLPEAEPWPDFRKWRLPDKLVWVLIGAGFGSLLPVSGIQVIGLNLILIIGLIYSLQGLAVLSSLLARWNFPVLFQAIIFSLILLQTYSLIFLAMLGLADIWFNIRKEKQIT